MTVGTGGMYLGVTPPISTAGPGPGDDKATESLVDALHAAGLFESEEESQLRIIVLSKLNAIFKSFVRSVSIRSNLPETIANEAGGKVFSFGSFRLGVHGKGSDIDTLCVAPKHVKREDFFPEMHEILKNRPEVTEIAAVSDAFVPVIKLVFSGISIDLVFARLGVPTVPESLELLDNSLLRNLDERCVRSLNGSRVTDEMLRLVPNINAFRIVLRCIKHWAKQRAIYANVFGFFGGVAWAIAVARVCQLYPNAAASTIVAKFFRIMHQWNWPQPVLLRPIEEANLGLRTWNPKLYIQDRGHRMPIITPAYPSMCATHNVTRSTQQVKLREFERAADITDRIMIGSAQWSQLFEKHDFFSRYKYYLQIVVSSNTADNQLLWSGMVESRLRQLVMKLESVEDVELAHPFIKGYDRTVQCTSDQDKHDAAHGIFKAPVPVETIANDIVSATDSVVVLENGHGAQESTTVTQEVTAQEATPETTTAPSTPSPPPSTSIYTTCLYIGLSIKPKEATGKPRKLDISWPIQEFVKLVKNWDKFDEGSMGVVVRYIKAADLPSDVFDGQEPTAKPAAKKKTKKRKQSAGTASAALSTTESPLVTEAKRAKLLPEEEPEDPVAEQSAGIGDPQMTVDQTSPSVSPSAKTQQSSVPVSAVPSRPQEIPAGIQATLARVKKPEIKLRLG